MAYVKKHYRSIDPKTGRHQLRGGGYTDRKNRPHRYATRPVETPISPTYRAACGPKKVRI